MKELPGLLISRKRSSISESIREAQRESQYFWSFLCDENLDGVVETEIDYMRMKEKVLEMFTSRTNSFRILEEIRSAGGYQNIFYNSYAPSCIRRDGKIYERRNTNAKYSYIWEAMPREVLGISETFTPTVFGMVDIASFITDPLFCPKVLLIPCDRLWIETDDMAEKLEELKSVYPEHYLSAFIYA